MPRESRVGDIRKRFATQKSAQRQDPATSLNPVSTLSALLDEVGQARACFLLYPSFRFNPTTSCCSLVGWRGRRFAVQWKRRSTRKDNIYSSHKRIGNTYFESFRRFDV